MSPKRRKEREHLSPPAAKAARAARRIGARTTAEPATTARPLPGGSAATVGLQRSLGNAGFGRLMRATVGKTPGTGIVARRAPDPDDAPTLLTAREIAEAKAYYRNQPGLYTTTIIAEIQSRVGVEATGKVNDATVLAVARLQLETAPLKVDGKAGPRTLPAAFPVGLAVEAEQNTFAEAATSGFAEWTKLGGAQARGEAMTKLVNERLIAAGVPPFAVKVKDLGSDAGSFDSRIWTMNLDTADFSKDTLSKDEQAAIADTLYHEARHCEHFFMMAQMLAGRGRSAAQIADDLQIPTPIAKAAKDKPLARGSMPAVEAAGWFEALFGTGNAHRAAVYARLEWATKLVKAAIAAVKACSTPATLAKLEAARKLQTKAYDAVLDLPDEHNADFVAGGMRKIFEANQP